MGWDIVIQNCYKLVIVELCLPGLSTFVVFLSFIAETTKVSAAQEEKTSDRKK